MRVSGRDGWMSVGGWDGRMRVGGWDEWNGWVDGGVNKGERMSRSNWRWVNLAAFGEGWMRRLFGVG